ncbi:hypothetical protein B0H16DRAFT_323636 [Mycena metata]|uniref:Uncharacterized protein n=1 Tax=Mycena metata TaxID=1033252 RepID=A0AAD7HPG5_9AGAR|nr:hypothetical protein B0H16DRAFT_323636 [Mycena metata]
MTVPKQRVQDAVLCAMDNASFPALALLGVQNPTVWEIAKKFFAAYAVVGDTAFSTNVENIVVGIVGINSPDIPLLVDVLTSSTTVARLLLTSGSYENAPPCPFEGMDEPEGVGLSWRVLLAIYLSVSPTQGAMNLRLFLRKPFILLAQAAARSLSPAAHIRKPRGYTTYAEARRPQRVKPAKKPKMMTMAEKSALYELTNVMPSPLRRKKKVASKLHPAQAPPSPSPNTTTSRRRPRKPKAPVPAAGPPAPQPVLLLGPPPAPRMSIGFLLNL